MMKLFFFKYRELGIYISIKKTRATLNLDDRAIMSQPFLLLLSGNSLGGTESFSVVV